MTSRQEHSSLPTSPKRISFGDYSPSTSPRPSTPPQLSSFSHSPSSSPVPKRVKKTRTNLLAFHNAKRKSNQPDPEAIPNLATFNSSIIGSLSLEHPALFDARVHKGSLGFPPKLASVTNYRQKRNTTLQRESKTTFYIDDFGAYDHDFDQYLDKRASIRSDPGDEFAPISRSRFSWKPKGNDSKPNAIPKSETVAGNMSNLSNGGFNLTEGTQRPPPSVFEPDPEGSASPKSVPAISRVGSGGLIKSQNRKSATGGSITKGAISLPTGPLYKAVPHPPSRKKVVGQFVLQYTGGEGATEGYYRETATSVTVNIKPSLIFEQFDLRSVEG